MPPSAPATRLITMARPMTTPMLAMSNQSAARIPVRIAKPMPLRRPTAASRRTIRQTLDGDDLARRERPHRDGHGLRRGVAALARDDRRQHGERHHLLELSLEQAEHRGGDEGRDEVDEKPAEARARDRPDRIGQFLVAPDAAQRLQVLLRLLLDDVDDIVDRERSDEAPSFVDHGLRHEVVAFEQARHVFLVVGGVDRMARLGQHVLDAGLALGAQQAVERDGAEETMAARRRHRVRRRSRAGPRCRAYGRWSGRRSRRAARR